jgi:DNA-binding NarL/FixJ family response regulator
MGGRLLLLGKKRMEEAGEPTPARIIVADDHPLFRSAMRTLVEKHSESWEVVAEASDGQEALDLSRSFRPDLVLMDLRMPRMDGLEATRVIKGELPRTIVLMMSASEEPAHLAEAIKAGAAGYVLKSAPPQRITDAIRRALDGESPLNQEIAMRLLVELIDEETPGATKEESLTATDLSRRAGPSEGGPSWVLEALTAREKEVLRLIVRGQTNQQIARSLLISPSTVSKHVHQIFARLGVSDRTQAAVLAIRAGLFPEEVEE